MTRRWPRVLGTALTLIVGVWAGARIYSSHHAEPAYRDIPILAGQSSATTPGDFESSAAEAMPPGVKIPDRLPDFSLQDRGGKPVSIRAWPGKSLVINFWATWCAPCRREIPLLESLQRAWAGRGVAVIGIAVDHRDQVLAYADDLKIGYSLLIGEQDALDAAAAFGVGPLRSAGVTLPEIYGASAAVAAVLGALSFAIAAGRPSPAALHPRPASHLR